MQPAHEPRIVHVGLPAVEGEGLTAAYNRSEVALRQLGEIDVALCGIGPSQLQVLAPRQRMHVGNIPLVATPHLDAERVDQHQMREPGGRTHHHLRRHPTTETGADEYCVLELKLCG